MKKNALLAASGLLLAASFAFGLTGLNRLEAKDAPGEKASKERQSPPAATGANPGITWVSIPAGSFEMGCSQNDEDCYGTEHPRHPVQVPAFKITRTEITQAQYEQVMHRNPSHFKPPDFSACGNCPVENVDWTQAQAFCRALGARLPSEAEWEYAARAGTTAKYYSGHVPLRLDDIAWNDYNSDGRTHPAGEKKPNAFGLYDMLGNVWEWVEDCYHGDYNGAPADGSAWVEKDCSLRVLRGGCWKDHGFWSLRASDRNYGDLGSLGSYLGFRCARD